MVAADAGPMEIECGRTAVWSVAEMVFDGACGGWRTGKLTTAKEYLQR